MHTAPAFDYTDPAAWDKFAQKELMAIAATYTTYVSPALVAEPAPTIVVQSVAKFVDASTGTDAKTSRSVAVEASTQVADASVATDPDPLSITVASLEAENQKLAKTLEIYQQEINSVPSAPMPVAADLIELPPLISFD